MSDRFKNIWRKIFIRLLVILLLAPFIVTTVFYFHLTGDMHSEVRYYANMLDVKPKDISVTTQDGIKLSGWYLSGKPDKAAVVLLHGIGASRMQMVDQARFLQRNGHTVVLFDFRNHGTSSGNRTTYGWRERFDAIAMVDFIREIHPERKVVLWGLSMGAATALLSAPEIAGLDGAIVESPFDSMENTFYHHNGLYFHLPDYPLIPMILGIIGFFGNYDIDKVSPIEAVKRSQNIPMLFVAGKEDKRMIPELVKSIADAHKGEHRYFLGEGSHAIIFQTTGDPYKKEVLEFLKNI